MNMTTAPLILEALFGLGACLLAWQAFSLLADILTGLGRLLEHKLRPLALRRLAEFQELGGKANDTPETSRRVVLTGMLLWQPFWFIAGVLAAAIMADQMRSPLAFALILTGGEVFRSTARSKRMQAMDEDASSLIVQFTSRFPISRSISKTLRNAAETLPARDVRMAVEACLARLALSKPLDESMLEMGTYP